MVGGGSGKDVGTGAAVGAGVGSVFGPAGTVIGGGLGALGGWLFGGGDDSDDAPMMPSGYGWMSPVTGGQKSSDIWGPPPLYVQYGTGMQAPVSKPIQHARGLGGEATGEQRMGLGMLRRRASGEDSVARQVGQREREATQRQILSTARSGRRGPAASRTALMQTSQAGQMISGKIAEAETKERLAAEKAYFAAASGMRGDALKQQQAEQQWWGMKADWERVKKEVFAKYLALGLSDKEAERRARMDYQRLIAEIQNKHLQHKDQMSQQENAAWMGLISSGIQSVGAVAAAESAGSDIRGKTNISKLSGPSYVDLPIAADLYMSEPVGSNMFVSSDISAKQNVAPMTAPLTATPSATQMATQPVSPMTAPVTGPTPARMAMPPTATALPPTPAAPVAPAMTQGRMAAPPISRGGAEMQRPSPVAPQQGALAGGMAEEKPDIEALRAMMQQMGGRI